MSNVEPNDAFGQGVTWAQIGGTFFGCPYERHINPHEFAQWLRGFNVTSRRMVDNALAESGRRTLREWALS